MRETRYLVTFVGTKGEKEIIVPTFVDKENLNGDTADAIIDLAILLGEEKFGKDFREVIDSYSIGCELADSN